MVFITHLSFPQQNSTICSLKNVLRTKISDRKKVDIYNQIAEKYRSSDSSQTALFAYQAIQLAKVLRYYPGIADAYYHIGWATFVTDNYQKSIELFEKSIKIARQARYQQGQANAYNGLGLAYKFKGNFPKALDYYLKALAIDQALNNQEGLAIRYNNIGVILKRQGAYTQALNYYYKILRSVKQLKNRRITALAYSNVGDIYYLQGNYSKAIHYLQKALVLTKKDNNKVLMAFDYLKLGATSLALNHHDKAIAYLQKSLNIRKEIGAKARYGEALVFLGKTYYGIKKYNLALTYLTQGIALANNNGNPKIVRDGAEILTKVYQATGDYQSALKQHIIFKQISDSLKHYQVVKELSIKEGQLKFQHEKDSLQLAQEKEQLAFKVKLKAQENTLKTVGLIVVLLLSIVLLVSYLDKKASNRKLSKANKQTQQANNEILSINESLKDTLKVVENQRDEITQQQKELQTHHQQLAQAYQSIRLLTVVGQEITATLHFDKVLNVIYEHVKQFMDVRNFGIGLYNVDDQTIDYRLLIKKNKQYHASTIDIHDKNQPAVWCVDHKKPIHLGDMSTETDRYIKNFHVGLYLRDTSLQELPDSAIYMPLIVKEKVVGIIVVHSQQKNAYTAHHFNLLKSLSMYVAIAIENARIHQQMDEKNKTLQALDDFKQQLMNMMVHDLKNPLNNIIGLSEDANEASPTHLIHQSGLQMLQLIMNILDTQKLEEAELQPSQKPQNSNAIIQRVLTQIAWQIKSKNIQIIQKVKDIPVSADQHLIQRVLINLLSNAVKYSSNNSEILIQAERIDHRFAKFSITDTGIGIPEEALGKVFNKFYQVNPQSKSQNYSTGLGLTFCKLTIEAHGGQIGVNSSLNLGSTFWFTLPLVSKRVKFTTPVIQATKPLPHAQENTSSAYLSNEDKQYLAPWLEALQQYHVYELSKVKAVLNKITPEEKSPVISWKQKLEQALYTSNEEQYQALIRS